MNILKHIEYTAIITGSTKSISKEIALLLIKKWNERYYIF
jgi:hypothetical protein